MRRFMMTLAAALIAVGSVVGVFVFYALHGDPVHGFGHQLLPFMPRPLHDWGCRAIADRITDYIPEDCGDAWWGVPVPPDVSRAP
jgi:hypothetical protein